MASEAASAVPSADLGRCGGWRREGHSKAPSGNERLPHKRLNAPLEPRIR